MMSSARRGVRIGWNALGLFAAGLAGSWLEDRAPRLVHADVFTAVAAFSALLVGLAFYVISQFDKLGQDMERYGFDETDTPFRYVTARRNHVLHAGIAATAGFVVGSVCASMLKDVTTGSGSVVIIAGYVGLAAAALAAVRITTAHRGILQFRREVLRTLDAQQKRAEGFAALKASEILPDISTARPMVVLPPRQH